MALATQVPSPDGIKGAHSLIVLGRDNDAHNPVTAHHAHRLSLGQDDEMAKLSFGLVG